MISNIVTSISTSMCAWMANESIAYFMPNVSEVDRMDMSKAFDSLKHSTLFKKPE